MITAIHQGHYFPWLGYLDKINKADTFVVLDEVQLETPSPMVRNKFLDSKGNEITITVDVQSKGYLDKKACEIEVANQTRWQRKTDNFFKLNYKKAPFFDEIYPLLQPVFTKAYRFLIDVELDTVNIFCKCFSIKTPIKLQSELNTDKSLKNNEMLIDILKSLKSDKYLSGNGAKKYMDLQIYRDNGIAVSFQHFSYPEYPQYNTEVFKPNLSAADILFNLGCKGGSELLNKNKIDEEFL